MDSELKQNIKMQLNTCPICQNNNVHDPVVYIKDLMYDNLDKSYLYVECGNCNALYNINLHQVNNLYDNNKYYSFKYSKTNRNKITSILNKYRYKNHIFKTNKILNFLDTIYSINAYNLNWLVKLHIKDLKTSILDVGCGSGEILNFLQHIGFTNLTGIDPFIENEINENSLNIYKKDISEITGKYDIIMFHHVFEHLNDPINALQKAKYSLNSNGQILIRTPFKDSFAWNHYKENWVQLDAPRHIVIQSMKSLNIMIQSVGLKIRTIHFDSTNFQFIGSEQYLRGIPLYSSNSYYTHPEASIFTKQEIEIYTTKAKELNKNNNGDQLLVILEK